MPGGAERKMRTLGLKALPSSEAGWGGPGGFVRAARRCLVERPVVNITETSGTGRLGGDRGY